MVLGCFYSHITAAVQEKGIFLEQAMDIVREHGITAVDINSADLQPSPEAFKTLLDKHGLHVASTHAYFPCGVATQEEYDASLARMKKDMHKAAKAGSTFFMPVPQKAPSYRQEEDAAWRAGIRKLFSEVISYGKEAGLQVVIENFSLAEYPYTTFDDMAYLFTHNPELRYANDMGNYPLAGFDELEGMRRFMDKISYVHLKDIKVIENPEHPEHLLLRLGKYFDSLELGGGYLKVKEGIEELQKNNYQGTLIIEINCGPNVFDRTLASARYVNSILNP